MAELLRAAVCEDNPEDRERLLGLIGAGGDAQCESFESGEALLAAFYGGKYDLIFLDIYMGGMKGVDAARAIRAQDADVVLCFTTTSPDHALESYRLGALKYIEKPVRLQDVEDALRLATLNRRNRQSITLLIGGEHVAIPLNDILYFETRDHAVEVHTTSGIRKASQTVRLDDVEKALPPGGGPQGTLPFLRCHHSFLVNLEHVVRIDRDFVMKNGERAYIRSGGEKKCANILKRYLLDRLGRNGV